MKPLIIVNFKTYKEVNGPRALALAKEIAKVKKPKYDIFVMPPVLRMHEVATKSNAKVLSQVVSEFDYGAHTGSVLLNELYEMKVKGVVLNHSEQKMHLAKIAVIIKACKKNNMMCIVCSSSLGEMKKIAQLHPDYIAYEPSELIGGEISVTEANPSIIVDAIEIVKKVSKNTRLLVGAGVHSTQDIGHALLLGAHGVLLAHAVVKSKDPKKFLEKMLI